MLMIIVSRSSPCTFSSALMKNGSGRRGSRSGGGPRAAGRRAPRSSPPRSRPADFLAALLVEDQRRLEEGRRRQLVPVAGDDDLLGAEDGWDRVRRRELGGLVEDHEVEREGAGLEEGGHGERTHQEAGLERLEHGRDLGEKLAERL